MSALDPLRESLGRATGSFAPPAGDGGAAARLARAARRARLTVVPTMRSRAPKVPFIALVSMVLVAGVVGLLLFNTSMQQASFARTSLQDQADLLSAREQTLALQLDDLGDPQRLAQQARDMGMVPAGNAAFLDLRTGKVIGTPAPAADDNPLRVAPYPAPKPEALVPPVRTKKVWPKQHRADSRAGRNTQPAKKPQRHARASAEGAASTGRND